jgi:hypothetical protein
VSVEEGDFPASLYIDQYVNSRGNTLQNINSLGTSNGIPTPQH